MISFCLALQPKKERPNLTDEYPSLRKGFLHLFTGSAIGRAFGFLLNILLSRILGPSQLGIFSFSLTISQTFELVTRGGIDFGLECALTSKSVENKGFSKSELIELSLRWINVTTLIVSLVGCIWVFAMRHSLPEQLGPSSIKLILIVLFICIFESLSGLPWDLLLLEGRTKLASIRQGLFAPIKILSSIIGALVFGLNGALIGYALVSLAQLIWLQKLGSKTGYQTNYSNLSIWKVWPLIKDGIPLYLTNLASAFVFLPLLADVAIKAGTSDVGYLKVGQIVVQVFSLIPGALAPILFIKSRKEKTAERRGQMTEESLILIWTIGLFAFLIYRSIDVRLIELFFGGDFSNSLQPTRMLIYIAILDSVSQILHIGLLAQKKVWIFFGAQNCAALIAAILGWLLVPVLGLNGYLLAKLSFVLLPLIIYLTERWNKFIYRGYIMLLLAGNIAAWPLSWQFSTNSSHEIAYILIILATTVIAGLKVHQIINQNPRRSSG